MGHNDVFLSPPGHHMSSLSAIAKDYPTSR